MRKLAILIALILASQTWSHGQQRYESKSGFVSFFSSAPLEDIFAQNNKVKSLLDLSGKEVAFIVSIVDFEFEKSLMKTHFNDKYLESEIYPRATFSGKIITDKNLNSNGEYEVFAEGIIEIHGIKKPLRVPGKIIVSKEAVDLNSEFILKPADFKIKIPKMVIKNIAEEILVKVQLSYVMSKK